MQNKPIIGVMPLWDGKMKSVWIHVCCFPERKVWLSLQ